MHAWRVNNVVYVETRRDDLLREAQARRLASRGTAYRSRPPRLAYLSGVVLYRVGSRLVRLGRQLQGMLPEGSSGGEMPDVALAGPVKKMG
ncbi:MAG: hypothetical protein IT323_17070 [Anaerolineae bacterium]|nr:hypothetical protein [Anaerolineae bacterium]